MKRISIITILFVGLAASFSIPQVAQAITLQEKLNKALAENAALKKQVPSSWSITLDSKYIRHPFDTIDSIKKYIDNNPKKSVGWIVAAAIYSGYLWWQRTSYREFFEALTYHKINCVEKNKSIDNCGCKNKLLKMAQKCRSYLGLPNLSLRKEALESTLKSDSRAEIEDLVNSHISPAYIGFTPLQLFGIIFTRLGKLLI